MVMLEYLVASLIWGGNKQKPFFSLHFLSQASPTTPPFLEKSSTLLHKS